MGAKIAGKLVRPNLNGRTLKFLMAPEWWRFAEEVLPAFIDRDIVIEVYERKTPTKGVVVELDSRLRKRLAGGKEKESESLKAEEPAPKKRGRKRKARTNGVS